MCYEVYTFTITSILPLVGPNVLFEHHRRNNILNRKHCHSSCFIKKVIHLLHFNSFYCCMRYIYSCHKNKLKLLQNYFPSGNFFINRTELTNWHGKNFCWTRILKTKRKPANGDICSLLWLLFIGADVLCLMSTIPDHSLLIPMTYAHRAKSYLF